MSEKTMQTLKGKIALVTGASRGGGRGIATELGQAGAIVYVTGRSGRNGIITSETKAERPLTVDETARIVTEAGGVGIPVYCDHTKDEEVEGLYQRIESEQGKLDILVNNAWGGYEGYNDAPFDSPFWEQPLWRLDRMYTTGLRSHNITAVALAPGWMRTEDMLSGFNTDEEHFRETPLTNTESPRYIGRAVVALATDKDVIKKAGKTLLVGSLASEYGFTDTDGTQPKFYGE